MSTLKIDEQNSLYYEQAVPEDETKATFIFVNALTGNTQAWESVVAPNLREKGYGTLSYNFRGQDGSSFSEGLELTPTLIIEDLKLLLDELKPINPVLVGLSIGGLFATHAILQGAHVKGLVLLNTLREIGPRIAWVNDAMPQIVAAGGVPLFLDALFPLLVNQEFAAKSRGNFLKGSYEPLPSSHGHANLMRHAAAADWEIDYSQLKLPTLVVTGLQDRVFYEKDVVDRLFKTLPQAHYEEWADAGHLLPQERPEKLAESLHRFAGKIDI